MSPSTRRGPTAANLALLAASTLVSSALGYAAWSHLHQVTLGGSELNVAAWEASFRERGLAVPESGPREGWWGARLGKKVPDKDTHHHEPETHVGDLVDIDADGLQHAANATQPKHRVLVIGASVAFGANASSIDATWYSRMLDDLGRRDFPIALTVHASGRWTTFNETAAWRAEHAAPPYPDLVVFLDGLNDLSQSDPLLNPDPVKSYLANIHAAADLSRQRGVPMVVVLQPLLAAKRHRTALEERILHFPINAVDKDPAKGDDWPRRYVDAFDAMRAGLREFAAGGNLVFVDCSAAFDSETATTFADFWHFADPGHRLLGSCVADGLAPVLAAREHRPS